MAQEPLRAILWDVDGTLAETERDGHRIAFNEAFVAAGLPWQWDVERYGELLNITGGRERILHDLLTQALAPTDPADREALARALHLKKNILYAERMSSSPIALRPGVRELLEECRDQGMIQGIVTTTSRSNVAALLSPHLGQDWGRWFPILICGEDVAEKKPHPEAYQRALAILRGQGISAKQAVAIEDSTNGVRAACSAGIAVVLTQSIYFADADRTGTIASGPGLDQREGWIPQATSDVGAQKKDRIRLDDLVQWHARACVEPLTNA